MRKDIDQLWGTPAQLYVLRCGREREAVGDHHLVRTFPHERHAEDGWETRSLREEEEKKKSFSSFSPVYDVCSGPPTAVG